VKDIYYVNSAGVKLNLLAPPYMLQTGEIFDYKWLYKSNITSLHGGKIEIFFKEVEERALILSIINYGKKEYCAAIDRFCDVTEYDVVNEAPGKLYFGDQYIPCYLTTSRKTEWESDSSFLDNNVTLVIEKPFWITEKSFQYLPKANATAEDDIKVYNECTYPYRYPALDEPDYLANDHYAPVDFRMIVYGPRLRTNILIGDQIYHVEYPISGGEYMVIDSRDIAKEEKRVYLVRQNGETVNLFNYRDTINSIFTKIPPGNHVVDIGEAGMDITVYKSRSEPEWSQSEKTSELRIL